MITIKLPYKSTDKFQLKLSKLRQQYSCVVRFAYNRFIEDKSQKDIRLLCKDLKNIELLDSWLVQNAIMEALFIYKRTKENTQRVVFGGKFNFKQLIKTKITKEQFKEKRLLPLNIQGEATKSGNRKFKLNIIDENQIIFKLNTTDRYNLELPKLKNNYKNQLYQLEELNNVIQKVQGCTYQIKLTEKFIFISFDLPTTPQESINTRVLGIDLNPDNIGISISDWSSGKQHILETKYFDLSQLTNKLLNLNVSSEDPNFKYINNKLNNETFEISKSISNLAKHYQCGSVVIEDLKFDNTKSYSKIGNRKCKNLWKRNKFIESLKRRLHTNNIQLISIHPAYTSFIGNLQYNYPDSINASLEISRRGYETKISPKKNKSNFYPCVSVKHQWKEMATEISTWKELFVQIKNSKLKYRIQLTDTSPIRCFSLKSTKSNIKTYCFDVKLF